MALIPAANNEEKEEEEEESSEVRREVRGISYIYTPITHTLYSLIKRQTHFCVVFIDHSDTCASFLASFS